MKTLSVCLLLCVVTTLTRAAAVPEAAAENDEVAESYLFKRGLFCSRGWIKFKRRCFHYVPKAMTWVNAEKNCQAFGGNLASVHDATEYQRIQKLILTASYGHKEAWIGGSDAQQEGNFLWSNGKPFHYSNWCSGEPSYSKKQHCIQMNYSDSKCWDNLQCWEHRPSVCAKRIW